MRCFLVLLALLSLCAGAQAQDFQSWNEVDLAASRGKIDFLVPLLARTDSSLPNPQLAATGITADIPIHWHLVLTGGYLFVDLPQKSLTVHVPLLALTPSFRIKKLSIADRNRFEKLFEYSGSPVRFRNRILVDESFGKSTRWHAFADNEAFWNLSDGAWNQNRFQAGGGARLGRRLSLDIYYLRRNAGGGAAPINVLGTDLRISLTQKSHGR